MVLFTHDRYMEIHFKEKKSWIVEFVYNDIKVCVWSQGGVRDYEIAVQFAYIFVTLGNLKSLS